MNKELEEQLKQSYDTWQARVIEADQLYAKGCITAKEYFQMRLESINQASDEMFASVHQLAEW